jgi:hypothetical protein
MVTSECGLVVLVMVRGRMMVGEGQRMRGHILNTRRAA